jgi:Protein  of unknown function (DUF3018)
MWARELALQAVARYLVAMNDLSPKRTDKFRNYRARKKAAGLREVRIWVPDVRDPEFLAQLQRDADTLRGRPEEQEALDFIEVIMADTLKSHPY